MLVELASLKSRMLKNLTKCQKQPPGGTKLVPQGDTKAGYYNNYGGNQRQRHLPNFCK